MKVVRDEAYQRFVDATRAPEFAGLRVKDVRDRALTPGGRARVTLFERAPDEERPHPRLRTAMPPAKDPGVSPGPLFPASVAAPTDTATFRGLVESALRERESWLAGRDLSAAEAPKGSEHFFRNSVRVQRIAAFFAEAGAALKSWVSSGALARGAEVGARRALAELADEAYAGQLSFDDADTGTYHSFQHDKPFVHYLEAILETLPDESSEGFALLSPDQQESVVRQRGQARNHLDHLMRRKYANHGITETDIERTLGGLLIERGTRHVASETLATRGTLVPGYELLRVEPGSAHPRAGDWLYRGDDDRLHLEDSGEVVDVPAEQLRSVPVQSSQLTFKRAPDDKRLRKNIRFDWDGNGYVSSTPVGWISWAGHCDIKAIMEQLGLVLAEQPELKEYRSDTGGTETYNRDLILEMIASVFELGSVYSRLDGSGKVARGISRFGGARNDSLPDRLQWKGVASGKSFRFPMGGRQDVFTVTRLEKGGAKIDLDRAFFRWSADLDAMDFGPNPLFQETVEGDYNIIDVTDALIEAEVQLDEIDAQSGYPVHKKQKLVLDLRPEATESRVFLGTLLKDAARREIWKLTLDRQKRQVEAESLLHVQEGGRWVARSGGVVWQTELASPLTVTLSREMKADDPALFQALLGVALREAQNINADTDDKAEVWNGTVVSLDVRKLAAKAETRVEHWKVSLRARFGSASMQYLLRRAEDGAVTEYVPLANGDSWTKSPDFLWQSFPDVGSKGTEGADWVANAAMWERGIIEVRRGSGVSGEAYVYDDHIKNLFELIFCALGGYPRTVLHNNKRYCFDSEEGWNKAVNALQALRADLRFEGGPNS